MPPFAFISYRRTDAQHAALALRAALDAQLGSGTAFLDVSDIAPGVRWPDHLRKQLETATVLLVVIGPRWLTAADRFGRRRIDSPDDWVRLEILHAIENGIPIIPVLVAGESLLPERQALPVDFASFLESQSCLLRDNSWERDVAALTSILATKYAFAPNLVSSQHSPLPNSDTEPLLPVETTGARGPDNDAFALQQLIVDEHATGFVGRTTAKDAFDRFLSNNSRGFFVVTGEPGQGKTAFASHVVKSRGLVRHFIRRGGSRADGRLILKSLIGQLLSRVTERRPVPDSLPELLRTFETLIRHAAARESPFIIGVDAIDELPEEHAFELPFLITEGLPDGAYYLVTSRTGKPLDRLLSSLTYFGVPHHIYTLGPLNGEEIRELLLSRHAMLTATDVDRLATASEGNALYLNAVLNEMRRNNRFDLQRLPSQIDGFFQRSFEQLQSKSIIHIQKLLGLMAVCRKPLSLSDISALLGLSHRHADELAIRPIRQYLRQWPGGYTFYHSAIRDFVLSQLLYHDEVTASHHCLAEWLMRPDCQAIDYRWTSLAYHLSFAKRPQLMISVIDGSFLCEKIARCGYDVLEDLELLSRAMLDAEDPLLVPRCVALVEELRHLVGGDLLADTHRLVELGVRSPERIPQPFEYPPYPKLPGLDVFVATLPKNQVGADFCEIVVHRNRVVVAIGDAPGVGLRGAFVARFITNLFRRVVDSASEINPIEILHELHKRVSIHEFFERVSMQCIAIDIESGTIAVANAGHPYPVIYSATHLRCDRLPVRGDCLHAMLPAAVQPQFGLVCAEFDAGDALVLMTDGLMESHCLSDARYGLRFMRVIEECHARTARGIGEAVLADWQSHPRAEGYFDDLTLIVLVRDAASPQDIRCRDRSREREI